VDGVVYRQGLVKALIDQAVAESIAFFSERVENDRNLLLGMLGHDMRGPLQVIQMTATYLSRLDAGRDVAIWAARHSKATRSLKLLLNDLLDFNRTKLGLGVTISPAVVDLAGVFSAELEQLRVANPGRTIELEVRGDVSGVWDINRLNQLLGNLVINALKYGASGSPVEIALNGSPGEVIFSVQNSGPKIELLTAARIRAILVARKRALQSERVTARKPWCRPRNRLQTDGIQNQEFVWREREIT
jgi:signal transduction histidine kinase